MLMKMNIEVLNHFGSIYQGPGYNFLLKLTRLLRNNIANIPRVLYVLRFFVVVF